MLTHRIAIRMTGVLWLAISVMLFSKGFQLKPSWMVVVLAGAVGCAKGVFVLQKTADRIARRIMTLPLPLSLRTLYPASYWVLMLSMMGLGMLLNVFHIPSSLRAFVDIAVGSALMLGASHYFRFICDKAPPLRSGELDKAVLPE